MFTGLIIAAWRGFRVEKGEGFWEISLGLISFALFKGTLWDEIKRLKALINEEKLVSSMLRNENKNLKLKLERFTRKR